VVPEMRLDLAALRRRIGAENEGPGTVNGLDPLGALFLLVWNGGEGGIRTVTRP